MYLFVLSECLMSYCYYRDMVYMFLFRLFSIVIICIVGIEFVVDIYISGITPSNGLVNHLTRVPFVSFTFV